VRSVLPRYLLRRAGWAADVNRTLGLAGSVALAVGGLAAGALPTRGDPFAHWPLIRELRAGIVTTMAAVPALVVFTVGLGLGHGWILALGTPPRCTTGCRSSPISAGRWATSATGST
jgi:hypothetical protein